MEQYAAEVTTNCVYIMIALMTGDLLLNNIFKKFLKLAMESYNHINVKDLKFNLKKVD
jgi:hypothetical protein